MHLVCSYALAEIIRCRLKLGFSIAIVLCYLLLYTIFIG